MALNLSQLKSEFGEAFTFLEEAYELGKGFTEALGALRAGGLGIAESHARTIYDYLSGPLYESNKYVSSLGLEVLPTISSLAPSITTILRNFSYTVKFNGVTTATGEQATQYVTISTNTLLTKQEAIDIGAAYMSNSEIYGLEELNSGDVVDILQNSEGLIE